MIRMITLHTSKRIGALSVVAACAVLFPVISGCGTGAIPATTVAPAGLAAKVAVRGRVKGGQQPIAGATVQIYAVGTSGIKSASTPLLNPAATTDANGFFSVTGSYSCPNYGSMVYIVSTGGNPGLGAATNNAAASEMAALGPCTFVVTDSQGNFTYTLDPSLFVSINEVTTVASVYALAPFMSDYAHVGGGANAVGITIAFNTVNILADTTQGAAPGPSLPSAVTFDPAAGFPVVIDTIADILSTCINSNGKDAACGTLFSLTTVGGSMPSNTIAAALTLATHPSLAPAALFSLVAATAPFKPSLARSPNDWTIALNYSGLNLSSPNGLALDSFSNLWIANQSGTAVTELYSGGDGVNTAGQSAQYTGGGLLGPQAIAIDQLNQVWIANTAGNSIVEMDGSGNILSGNGYTAGGINAPVAIAIDPGGNSWIANFNGNSITELSPSGQPSSFSPITQGYYLYAVALPVGIAVDSNNQVWVSNSGLQNFGGAYGLSSQVLRFDQNGNPQPLFSQNLQGPRGVAIDPSNNAWVAGNGTSLVEAFDSTGAATLAGGFSSGGGLNQSSGIAIDGAGTVWVTNSTVPGNLTELTAATGTPASSATGFGSLNVPMGCAVDRAGNVWTANFGDNSLTQFVGAAAPTETPIVSNLVDAGAHAKPGRGKLEGR